METRYIENIVIGTPLIPSDELLAKDIDDWKMNEFKRTYFTNERFLPKILVKIGIYPSVSEIRRNRPDLMIELNEIGFIDKLRVAKNRFVWIVVGGNRDD